MNTVHAKLKNYLEEGTVDKSERWWASLNKEQQKHYLKMHPKSSLGHSTKEFKNKTREIIKKHGWGSGTTTLDPSEKSMGVHYHEHEFKGKDIKDAKKSLHKDLTKLGYKYKSSVGEHRYSKGSHRIGVKKGNDTYLDHIVDY